MNRDKRDASPPSDWDRPVWEVWGADVPGEEPRPGFLLCKKNQHLVRDMKNLDAYVTAYVLDLLKRDVHDLIADDVDPADHHRAVVAELRGRLDDAIAAFSAGQLVGFDAGQDRSRPSRPDS